MRKTATHKVSFYGVRCYLNENTGELWGCNWLLEQLLMLPVLLHWFCQQFYIEPEESFPLVVLEDYTAGLKRNL